MGQLVYRANLAAPSFPFLSENFGKTVIVKGQDQNSVPNLISKADEDKDAGVPQLYFCENVLPTGYGYQSVTRPQLFPDSASGKQFKRVVPIQSADGKTAYLAQTVDGHVFIRRSTSTDWEDQGGGYSGRITTAYWFGRTHIFFEKQFCMYYDFDLNVLVSYALTALDETKILGVFTAGSYFCAYDDVTIFWAVPDTFPPDFTPSLITGAGSISLSAAKSAINVVQSHGSGAVVYTAANAVLMVDTGNALYPFSFKELPGCGGLTDVEMAVTDVNASGQYVYTTSGMQLVTGQGASTVMPELTDFLSGTQYEYWNGEEIRSITLSGSNLHKKLNIIADRYLCISYGTSPLVFEFVLVYDLTLKRWGKLRHFHTDLFELSADFSNVNDMPKRSIGLLEIQGRVVYVSFDPSKYSTDSVMILGKFQYVRTRHLQLEKVSLECIDFFHSTTVSDIATDDGKTPARKVNGYQTAGWRTRDYLFRVTGYNHSIVVSGGFNINSVILHFNVHGRR